MKEDWRGFHPAVDGERLKMMMMMNYYDSDLTMMRYFICYTTFLPPIASSQAKWMQIAQNRQKWNLAVMMMNVALIMIYFMT
jgi:hypothetical protein